MHLSLLLGRAGYGKTYHCLHAMRREIAQNPDGHPLILIVPEQATFVLEKLLAQLCTARGFTRAYVVGFRRLAYRVLSQTGGCARPHITELGKRLAISRILLDNKEQLKILGQMPKEEALSPLLSGLIKDFKNYGVIWEDLSEICHQEDGMETTPLGKKLSDLALIYKNFDEFLAGRYTDPEDYIKLLAEKIPVSSLIKNAQVWVDGFSWFTPQEYDALEALIKTAMSVKVTLCLGEPESFAHELPESLFHNQWQTRRRLLSLAGKLKCSLDEKELENPRRFFSQSLLAHIEKNFDYNFHAVYRSAKFQLQAQAQTQAQAKRQSKTQSQPKRKAQVQIQAQTQAAPHPPNQSQTAHPPGDDCQTGLPIARPITIAEAANQTVEAEIIAREILRLSREKGLRFKDMAVILRDSSYREFIEPGLNDYNIPFFSDSTRPVMHHPLAELIRSALDIVLERWSYEPIFRALKTDFFKISRDEVDILENYALEFGLRGSRWLDNRPWTFYRRYSLGEESVLDAQKLQKREFLSEINNIRFRATAELVEFSNKVNRHLPVESFAQALYELAVGLDVPGILDKWASAAEGLGDLEQAREHRQMWQAIVELLDQLVETFKGQTLPLETFAALVGEGLDNLSLSLIPPGLDYVTVADVKRTKLLNVKAAFVPGVNDGVFPARYQDAGLINDSEREFLYAAGVELPGGMANDLFAEKFLVYTALTRAGDYLWVSYALADTEGKAMSPSFVIKRLKEICGADVKCYPLQPPPGREVEYISTPTKTMSLLANIFRTCQETKTVKTIWRDVYNWLLSKVGGEIPANFLAGLFHANKSDTLDKELARSLFCARRSILRGSVTRFESFSACPFQHFARYGLRLQERPVYQLKAPDMGQFLHAIMKNFGTKAQECGQKWADLTHGQAKEWSSKIAAELAPALQNEILTSSAQYEYLLKNLEKKAARSLCRLIDFARKSHFEPLALEQFFGRGGNSLPPLAFDLPGESCLEVGGQIDRIDYLEHNGKTYALIIDYKSGGAALSLNEVFYGLKLQLMTYLLAVAQNLCVLPAGAVYCYLKNPVITAKNLLSPEKIVAKMNSVLKMPGWLLADWEIIKLLDGSLPGYSDFFRIGASNVGAFYETSRNQLKSPDEFKALLALTQEKLQSIGRRILTGETAIYPASIKSQIPCNYCSYQAVCQFDRYLKGNNYNILPNLDDKDIWAKLLK